MESPAPLPAPASSPARAPATATEKAAWILMAAGLLFVLNFHLLPSLLAGLLVYSLVHAVARRISGKTLSHHYAKVVAVSLLGVIIVAVAAALVLLLIAFFKGRLGHLPTLLDEMAKAIEGLRDRMGWGAWIPAAEGLKDAIVRTLREHSRELQHAGGEAGRMAVHALVGMVIGALASFEMRRSQAPLSSAIAERVSRLAQAFEKVVFAQLRISALNTVFTGIFLLVILPIFGVHLPLRKTLVLITFVVGLIPVLGNLVSNTVIVIVAMGVSAPAAVAALVFLVVIHKLEYFLNAKIVGRQIHAASWEILLAMLLMEAAFGLSGVILAPVAYAYAKRELADRGLI